jgi:hypothetical protein
VAVTTSAESHVVVPAPRPWGGLWRVLGLLALVAVAAAVGAIVARTHEPDRAPAAAVSTKTNAPAAPDHAAGGPPAVAPQAGEAADADDATEATDTGSEPRAAANGTTTDASGDGAASDDATAEPGTGSAEPVAAPTPSPRPTGSRKPSDASIKKKLAREIQRRCGAGAAGARVVIEGIVTAEGRVTGARVLDVSGEARSCIKGLVEAQRFPPGELRTLDLTVTL